MPKISLVKTPKAKPNSLVKKKPADEDSSDFEIGDPSGGLVPIGDSGFWITPDEPADPQDCDRYPTSPWCTTDFYTLEFATLEPSIVADACNVGVRLDGSIGYIRVPPVSLVYRNSSPECNPQPPKPPPIIANRVSMPPNNCSYNSRTLVIVTYTDINVDKQDRTDYSVRGDFKESTNITSIEYPYTADFTFASVGGYDPYFNDPIVARVGITFTTIGDYNEGYSQFYNEPFEGGHYETTVDGYFYVSNSGRSTIPSSGAGGSATAVVYLMGNREATNFFIDNEYSTFPYTQPIGEENRYVGYHYQSREFEINYACGAEDNHSNPPLPSEYNPLPRECCMGCCPSNSKEADNSLLNLLIEKVDKLSKVIGVEDYPVSLPTSLLSRDEGFLGNIIPNFNEDVPSLTRFLAWYVERFDEIMGQWEIPIEIKDSDPSKPGDQPLGVKLPNMAEAIAEMFTLVFQTNLNSETLLNFAVRTAAENATDKQQNFITYKLMQSMAEWAGYKQKDINLKMPLLFSLGKTRYDEILKESEVEVPCVDFDEKFGLEADLMRFREAVSILQATYKRKVNPSGDIKAEILKHLLDTFASVNKVNDENDDEDFKKFLTEVEDGFIHTPGAKETTEPYGRPYKERPKIRDLTNPNPPNPPNP